MLLRHYGFAFNEAICTITVMYIGMVLYQTCFLFLVPRSFSFISRNRKLAIAQCHLLLLPLPDWAVYALLAQLSYAYGVFSHIAIFFLQPLNSLQHYWSKYHITFSK